LSLRQPPGPLEPFLTNGAHTHALCLLALCLLALCLLALCLLALCLLALCLLALCLHATRRGRYFSVTGHSECASAVPVP
jgi:hypothetical protein